MFTNFVQRMNPTKILTREQLLFLDLFNTKKTLTHTFYLSGGTALTGFYLPFRYSEDLDFFSETEFKTQDVISIIKNFKKKLNYTTFDIQNSFNRNLVFLQFPDHILKLKFTYFPFPQLQKPQQYKNIKIDSLEDIAVNKLFTIYQKPRSRDFIDLYQIINKQKYSVTDLIKKAKLKFDWHVDPLKLASQFLLSTELKDYPRFIEKINHKDWQKFFDKEMKKLKNNIGK